MNTFTYIPDFQKEPYKQRIKSFVETYKNRLANQFVNLEEEVEKATEVYRKEISWYFDPERSDPAEFADRERDFAIDYWRTLDLMKYNTYMMTLATLYQIWEQQIRDILYREITRFTKLVDSGKDLQFKDFCTTFGEIKELFSKSDWPPDLITSWDTINELRLVQNVIKHGDGLAAKQLKDIQPTFFRQVGDTLIMDLYGSTLNETALTISDTMIDRYGEALIKFWEEMPTRVHFNIETAPDIVKGPIKLQKETGGETWSHFVNNQKLTPGCEIQIKFQKKKWISGTYHWSGDRADLPELHSKNSAEVILFRLNHQVSLVVR